MKLLCIFVNSPIWKDLPNQDLRRVHPKKECALYTRVAEFKLICKAKRVPRSAGGQAVCSVIDLKVYLVRLFYVSQF